MAQWKWLKKDVPKWVLVMFPLVVFAFFCFCAVDRNGPAGSTDPAPAREAKTNLQKDQLAARVILVDAFALMALVAVTWVGERRIGPLTKSAMFLLVFFAGARIGILSQAQGVSYEQQEAARSRFRYAELYPSQAAKYLVEAHSFAPRFTEERVGAFSVLPEKKGG